MPGYTARTQELGFKPKSVELQSPHIFSKKKQEVVLSNNKGPHVKSSGALSPLWGGGWGAAEQEKLQWHVHSWPWAAGLTKRLGSRK